MHHTGGRTRRRILSALAFVTLACGSLAFAAPTAAGADPVAQLAAGRAPLRGEAAIKRLGHRLDDVARRHRITRAELDRRLRTDTTLGVDVNEQLFYTEPLRVGVEPEPTPEFDPGPPATDDETFTLHSRPDAPRTIYLDFDGHTVSGSAWTGAFTGGEPCYGDPFTKDADPASFSASERSAIRSIWARVAEDYAPFDVDVTTEEPDPDRLYRTNYSDEEFGTRALITSATTDCSNDKTLYESVCGNCGGIAYVGVFNYPGAWHSAYQPALIFNNALSNNTKSIAEAVSHEVGHNLGLSHDGATSGCSGPCSYYTGHTMWAPIMGVGYSKPVVQWSKGEYSLANQKQDDFAIMQSYELELREDDHGDTQLTPTEVDSADIEVSGVISSQDDVDVFGFNVGAGAATFAVSPAATSPNLDAKLELRDANFTVVTSNNPSAAYSTSDVATGMSASISTTLTAGRYYLVVDGVGVGTSTNGYTDYASLGQYVLTGSAVPADPGSLSAPGAPTNVSAAPRNGGLFVTWEAPDDDGSAPISDYIVNVYDEFGDPAADVDGPTSRNTVSAATKYLFTGLTNGTTYFVKVAAVNAIGTSDESEDADGTPDGIVPSTTLKNPTGTWTLSKSIPVAWTAQDDDDGSGVASTQISRRTAKWNGSLGSVSTWKAAATVTPTTYAGSNGMTYCFKARAKDVAGNVASYTTERCTATPLTAASFTFSKGWTSKTISAAYNKNIRTTTKKGVHVSRSSIKAKRLALVATKCAKCGSVKVYWNGSFKKTISLKAASTKRKQVISLFTFTGVKSGTLKLVVSTTGKPVSLEGLGVSKV